MTDSLGKRDIKSALNTLNGLIYNKQSFNEDEDLRIPFPNRPTAEEQVKMINAKVGKADHLILLGDNLNCINN